MGRHTKWFCERLSKIRWLLWDEPIARLVLCTYLSGWNLTEITAVTFMSPEEAREVLRGTFARIREVFEVERNLSISMPEEGELRNPLPPIPEILRKGLLGR